MLRDLVPVDRVQITLDIRAVVVQLGVKAVCPILWGTAGAGAGVCAGGGGGVVGGAGVTIYNIHTYTHASCNKNKLMHPHITHTLF